MDDNYSNINQFNTFFPGLLKQFKEKYKIPLVIEISGTPNSGKTSLITEVGQMLERHKISYDIVYESANQCKINDKLSENFNIWTTCNTICSLVEKIETNKDIIIYERGIFDALCWADFHYIRKNISADEKKIFDSVISLKRFTNLISILFLFTCSAKASISRESFLLYQTEGRIVNISTINQLNECIDRTKDKYSSEFKTIIPLDTSNMDKKSLEYAFINHLWKTLSSAL